MAKNRNYNYKDVDMITAAKIITQFFAANMEELAVVRTDWTMEYAAELTERIHLAIENYLGVDKGRELRGATVSVADIQMPAMRDLSFFKTQIDEDFKKEEAKRDEILKTLGYSKYLIDVQGGKQEELLQLLYSFKKNITEDMKSEITSKGMSPTLIENIIGYAAAFRDANAAQEGVKETSKEQTEEIANAFNSIYDEVIKICKIASSYYQYEPLKKEQFTFSKVINNLNASRKVKE